MSAVKRWIYRHTSLSSSSSSSSSKQRGRSQSLDVQSLERSGIKTIKPTVNNVLYLKTSFPIFLHVI